jgi:antitoxin component YwqK of YwqJK toxin-antitoxin module
MAVDFMAHPVRFRNNTLFLILFLTSFGCKQQAANKPASPGIIVMQKTDKRIRNLNGIMLLDGQPFQGVLYLLYPATTDTAEISSYLNGKENGEWRKYFPAAVLKEKRVFINGKKEGEWIAYWENGEKQLLCHFKDDEYEGTCKEWNQAGFLVKQMNYKKGHEDGPQQWWYDNGKIKANYVILDGRRYGLLGTKNCVNVSDSVFKK